MKSNSSSSGDTSMSVERYSLKLRFLILVVNTADLINERATPTFGISHAIASPVAIFTTYILIGVLIIGAIRREYASTFLQCYALVTCSSLHTSLSIVVFKELRIHPEDGNAALVLNGVLPMLIIFVLLADLIVIMFSNRNVSLPVLPGSSSHPSNLDMRST